MWKDLELKFIAENVGNNLTSQMSFAVKGISPSPAGMQGYVLLIRILNLNLDICQSSFATLEAHKVKLSVSRG